MQLEKCMHPSITIFLIIYYEVDVLGVHIHGCPKILAKELFLEQSVDSGELLIKCPFLGLFLLVSFEDIEWHAFQHTAVIVSFMVCLLL